MRCVSPALTGKIPMKYPWLSDDLHAELCVVGGGLTGALCAVKAASSGRSVILMTDGPAGFGTTGSLPGWARADCGRTFTALDRVMDISDATELYRMGLSALDSLQELCAALDGHFAGATQEECWPLTGFERRDSLLVCRESTAAGLFEREYAAVARALPDSLLLTGGALHDAFDAEAVGAVVCKDGGASLDTFALTHLCLKRAEELGAMIFENTRAVDIQTPSAADGCVTVGTSTLRTVYADRLILATGSDGIREMSRRRREYTADCVITSPLGEMPGWIGRSPLLTFGSGSVNCRFTPLGCVCATAPSRGGHSWRPPLSGKSGQRRADRLLRVIAGLLPGDGAPPVRYAYSHPISALPDGLPAVGEQAGLRNVIFALCPGENGAAGSMMAAEAALGAVEGNPAPFPAFDPARMD